jgi:hypothetical protein
MSQIARIGCVGTAFILSLSACLAIGCNQSASDGTMTASNQPASSVNPSTDAIAKAAADFLDAVLKGDTGRASARLTPQAMQRIIASGKQFAPPGLETASFQIGGVRTPAEGQAIVQCVLTDTAPGDAPRSEEMCCLMRLVEQDWRVSGIAYGTGPNQPWMLSDFETGKSSTISRQPAQPGTPSSTMPRVAQDPAASSPR